MGLRLWDFATCSCGKDHRGWPITAKKIPQTIQCECGKRVGWVKAKQNNIYAAAPSLYGKKDPRFGVTFANVAEKKAYLKEHGIEESDLEHPDDIMNDRGHTPRGKRDPNMLIGDSLTEINEQIGKMHDIDRNNTGSLTGREGQDPETGLIESWREF